MANNQIPREITGVMGDTNKNIQFTGSSRTYKDGTTSYTPAQSAPKPEVSSAPAFPSITYAQKGVPDTASVFKIARYYMDNGEQDRAGKAISGYTQFMRTAGSPYYQPYYTSFDPDEKYESATLEVEQALRDMYQDVRVAVAKGYSDAWIASNITSSKYKALKAADEAVVNGNPKKYTRQIPYLGADTVYGMIYQARNGDEYNSDIFSDVARYYMGYGKQYAPDDTQQAIRDRTSDKWNPYAFGGASASPTMNSLCGKYGVMGFTRDWAQKHADELEANGDREKVFKIIIATEKAEEEYKRLQENIIQRLRDGESVDDIYNTYFGNNMAYLKSGRKADVLDDGEEGYPTLHDMEYNRQMQGAIDLAWEVPFSSYGIKDWMTKTAAPMAKQLAEIDKFDGAVPTEYQNDLLVLYAQDKGKPADWSVSNADMPDINAWVEEKGLSQKKLDKDADYGAMLSAYARKQQQDIADRTDADYNFSASDFLSAINETDEQGNKTLEAATANANFRLGLMSYYAGQPVTDQNAKSFISKYGWLLETDPESKAYLGGAVTVTGNQISAVDKLNAGATGYSWDNFGEIWKRAADTFDRDSDEWADTVLAFADAYDKWQKDNAADFMNATNFTQFVERTPEVKASLEVVDENRKAYVKAQEEQRETEKANKAKYVMGLYNRANNGERIEDLNELAVWEQVQSISVNDYANGIYGQGYRTALDHMKEFGTSYLSEGASVFGTNDMLGRMESENELLCTIASESVDDLLRMAAFSGMSVQDFCKSQNIDLDQYAENAYMSAYSDYQTGLQAATDVAQSIKDVIGGMSSREIDSLREGTEEIGIGRWEDHTQMLRNMVDRGMLTEQQFNAFERLYENGIDPDVISYGDKLLQRVMDGENVDVAAAADAFLNANAETYAENLKDQRKGQRSAANDINVTGESGNFFDVALNGMKGGGLIFANSALTATLGWLGADRETYEGWIRGNYTREEYRQIIEDGINEKIDNPALREELIAQLRTYTGDIYKFNINYRTLGVQDAQADMSQRIAALDAEMAGVLSPSAYKWYKRSAGATNSFLMSVPVMVAAAATRGKSLEKYQGNVTLLAQLISSGYIEGGQTAYTLQQNGVDAGSSKIAGLMAGALTGYSEFAFEGAVNKLMPYKGGIVKSIENATNINVGARALGVQEAIRNAGGGKFIASAAKWGTYGFLGAVNVGVQAFVGTGVEIAQEVQQTFTSALVANVYGEAMPEWEEYQQVISDTFYQSLIQGGVTGTVSQIQNTIQSNRANKRVISEQENALAGEQAVYMGALSSKQTQLNDLQKTLDAITEEREAGVRLMKDADSSARVQLRTVDLTVDEALKLHNSELVGNINSIQTENAQFEEMLAQLEESIGNANELYVQAEQEFMASEMPTDAEISHYNDAQRVLNAEISKRTQVQQRLDENHAKLAPMEQERRKQAQAIYDKAYQQAVEEEAQRRIAEEDEAEAQKAADLEMLQQQKREEIAQTQKEIAEIREGYRNRLKEVRLQGLQRVADAGGLASERALDAAERMFKELGGENEELAIAKEAAMKENLKHQLELSFPGFKVSWADMGAYEDAAVVFMDDETGELRINSRAPVAAVMSGIMAHEISHIAEMSQEHFTPYWNAIVSAVYGTTEQVKQALQKEVEELRKRNPGISEDTTKPNNVFSVAQKEIAAKAIETILGAKNSAFTTGERSVYQMRWADALAKGDPLLGNNIQQWLKLRAKELVKFAKANKGNKAVKAQYNNFARVANLLYDCLQDVANKNTRSAAERGAFIGNPADYNIGEPEAARTYAEREAPAARLAPEQTAQQEEVTLSDDDQREVDLFNEWVQEEQERLAEYGERIRKATDKLKKATTEKARQAAQKTIDSLQRASEKYEQAIADQKARIDEIKAKAREHFVQEQAQPVQKADEVAGEPVRTDTGFATAPQQTEQQSEQRASEPVAGITYAQREAPEAPTAAVQTEEATTTQPEQTAQESPAEAPTVRGESAEANEYAEREAPEESPYVETLDEDEDTEVEQEEQEQESEAPDTPATGEAVASTNPDVAAVSEAENAVAEGEEANISPEAIVDELKQAVEDAVEQDVSDAITEQPDTDTKLRDMEALLEGTKERITYWTDRANQAAERLAEATKAAAKKAAQKGIDFANRRAEAARQRVADLQTKIDALRASLETETQESAEQTAPETAPVVEQPTTKRKRNAVSEGQVSMFDQLSEYSRGFLARFNNSVLLNALQSQLEAARQSGNSAAYRRLAGRMLGIIRNATFDDTNKLNPVETLKRLADKIGSHIYEKVRMGAGEVSEYQEFARGILTNKAAATSFSALMENVGQAVLESAGATPDASGNVTLNGTNYTQAALNDMFLQWMTTNDAAVAASRLLTQFQDNLQAALQNSEGGQERLEALTTARNDLNTYLSTQRGEQIAYFVRSLDAQQKENQGWISKMWRNVIGQTTDKTVYADIIDKATDYQSNVRREVRYRPYGYGIASQLVDGRAFVDARGNRVAGAETLASWLERAYDNFDDYGGQNAVYQRINQVLMIQSALDRMNRGQNPFTDSYVLAGTDIGRLVNPDKQMLTDALNRIQSIDPNALQAAENVRRWFRDVMQTFGVNENFLSQKTLDDWNKRDPHYAPLLRFMNDTVDGGDELSGALGGSSLSSVIANNKGLQFKKAKGNSDRTVVNPIESMISMANVMVQKAINNQAGRAFAHAFDLTPGLGGMAVEISPEQALAYKGGSGERLLAVQSEVTGQPTRYFLLNNAELYDLLVGTSHTNYNSLFARIARFLGHGTHMMTRLTTGANPLFAFKNMVRDFQHSVNFGSWASNYGSGAVKWVRAFAEVASYKFRSELSDWFRGEDNARVSQQLEDFITLGGEDYTRYGQGRNLDVGQVRRSLMGEGVARRTGRHLMNIVTCASLNDAVEMASRYAEYKFGQNQTTDKKGATDESKRAAFMASREATTDFAQGGDSTGAYVMRQLIPFLNATLQGKYQELRAFSGAERGRLGARLAKTICNNAIMGTLSYLLCTAFGGGFDDDEPDKAKWVTALEEYDQISDSLKRDYFLLPFSALGAEGARDIIRIPLGHDFVSKVAYEMGRSAVENVMNAYYGKEASVSDWMGDFVMAGLDCIGELGDFTAITTPISSVMNNRSWTGNAIASDSLLSAGWSNAYSNSTWGGFRIGANIVNNLFECMGVTDDRLRMLGTPVGQEYLFQQYTGIVGQLLIPALSKDSYTGEKAMPLQSIERVITNAWTLDAESSTDIPDAFSNCLERIDSIVQSGNQRKGLGLLSANLTDEQVTMAHEEAKRLLSDNGELGQIKKQINELWGKYNSVMSDTSLSRKEREENAEPYRKEIVNLQEKGLAIGQQYYDKYDIEPSLLRGFVQGLQLNDRVVTPMTNAQRGNYDVSLNYDNVPDSYMQETQRLSEWYDAQPDDYKKQNGKTVSSKIYATPNLSFSYKKTKYDTADYPGSEDDVRTWYGEYYWQTYDKVIAGSKWQNADEEERIAMLSEIDTKANTYAKERFLQTYVAKK